ncbi:MAG: recombination protein RecR [Gammaproteobacteria bacterium]|jgi:recombination protein RecR
MSSSRSLDQLIKSLTCLPGVGQKSAQRMALHLIERDREGAQQLQMSIVGALETIQHCESCRNFSDEPKCKICENPARVNGILCVVETPTDVIAIESSGAYSGRYFVLLGRLSPLDGFGPEQLGLDLLERSLVENSIEEVILATSATVEGDLTARVVSDLASRHAIKSSRLARGIPLGGELEFVDSGTLSRALSGRQQYE